MATSAVPAAIDALLTILRAAPALADVQVSDGPPIEDQSAAELVAIGWTHEDALSAEAAQDFNSAGARTRDEDFSIAGWIDAWNGDDDITVCRDRAYELLAVIETAIRASGANPTAPTLNGAVLWAHLTRHALHQRDTDQGMKAGIAFTISCRARI